MTAVGAAPEASFFKLRTALLKEGQSEIDLAVTSMMKVQIKCYAQGGENALHAHPHEDHIFVVLQGQARFFDKDETARVVGRNECVLLPRGAFYYFQSCGDEPLVLLRVGAFCEIPEFTRIDVNGEPIRGDSRENKHVPPVPIEGAFYE
jgi:mannose-6-phosphate isomerase-like protein (cupin superfamily)